VPALDVDGARIAYRTEGEGPALALVHAGVADQRMCDPLVAGVADRFRVVRFDLRGFGETAYGPGEFSNADDAVALFDALGLERATVVGASFGGHVALELAATAPDRVERLVLLDALGPGHNWSPAMRQFFTAEEAALEAGRVEDAVELNVDRWVPDAPEDVRALVRDMQRRAFELQLQAEPEERFTDWHLEDVRAPSCVVYGERDVDDFVRMAHRLAKTLPSAKLHCVPEAGHLPALERPDAVAALL